MPKSKFNYQKILSKTKKLSAFLEELKEINHNTFRAYRGHLVAYFQYHNINDIDKYIKDTEMMTIKQKKPYLEKLRKDISKYWRYINYDKDNASKGKTPYVFLSAIKTFCLDQNTTGLDSLWYKLKKNGHGNHAITNTRTPTKEELLKIFNHANLEAKALFMVQLTSGQRISQITNMTFDNLELDHEYPRLYFPSSKNKYSIKTRITPEAKKILQQYLEQREKSIEIRRKRGAHNRTTKMNTDKVFAMTTGNAQDIWKTMVTNAGLYKTDENTNKPKYGTHCLRRYFLSHFTDRQWGDLFAGHITPVNKAYSQYTQQELDEEYIKNSQNLNVFTDDTEQKELLKITNKKLEKAEQKNKDLEKQLTKLDDKFKDLADLVYGDTDETKEPIFKVLELDEESRPIFWIPDKENGIRKTDPPTNMRLTKENLHAIKVLIKDKNERRNKQN